MKLVRLDDRDGIALVTIDRPPANAMDPALIEAGLAVLDELETADPDAVVLTGSGSFFSGGADLRTVPVLAPDEQAAMARQINRLFAGWYGFRRPVVCAVNGHAVAGGLILALCGDYRIVGESGSYGLTEVKVGIPYPSMAMAVVRAELAPAVARRLTTLGRLYDPGTAVELGLFDEQVADAQVLDQSFVVAKEYAALPPRTFEVVKRRLRAGVAESSSKGLFGGAAMTSWSVEESRTAASRVLDAPSGDAPDS